MKKTEKEEKQHWDEVLMNIQEGNILTSKKGFLSKSPITDEWFIYWKVKCYGNGIFVILGDKESVDIKHTKDEKYG